jgi:hypothetical protein
LAAPTPLRYSKPAGAAELGLRPQTVLALFPPLSPLLGASHGDPEKRLGCDTRTTNNSFSKITLKMLAFFGNYWL